MIEKLRKNFKLSQVLVNVAFLLFFVFANWQKGLTATYMVLGRGNLLISMLAVVLAAVILMFALPFVVGFLLNLCKIYSVPRAEYCLLAQAFFAFGYFLLGCFNLVHIFTPLLLVWGGALFPLVSSFVSALLFYKLTSKLYFNDLTRPYYFKMFSIVCLAVVVILEVL